MVRVLILLAICLGLRVVGPMPAGAGESRVALVIGNGRYANAARLDNPIKDAGAVAAALRAAGFKSVQVESDLTRETLLAALRRFEAAADDADWSLVYYAGHGIEVGGVNYLVPVDARLRSDRDVEDEAVSLQQVQKRLEGSRKLRIVILDACRDNPFTASMKRSLASRSSAGRGLARPELNQTGSLVAYSAAAGQVASDGEDGQANSPYAAALVRNLAEPDVEVNLFFRRVRAQVLKATGQRQEPATYESLPEDRFVFTPPRPAATVVAVPATALAPEAAPAATGGGARAAPAPVPIAPAATREPEPPVQPVLGLTLAPLTKELRGRYRLASGLTGVVVTQVEPRSPAARKGILPGHVVVGIAGDSISSPAEVARQVEADRAKGGSVTLLLVTATTGEAARYVVLDHR